MSARKWLSQPAGEVATIAMSAALTSPRLSSSRAHRSASTASDRGSAQMFAGDRPGFCERSDREMSFEPGPIDAVGRVPFDRRFGNQRRYQRPPYRFDVDDAVEGYGPEEPFRERLACERRGPQRRCDQCARRKSLPHAALKQRDVVHARGHAGEGLQIEIGVPCGDQRVGRRPRHARQLAHPVELLISVEVERGADRRVEHLAVGGPAEPSRQAGGQLRDRDDVRSGFAGAGRLEPAHAVCERPFDDDCAALQDHNEHLPRPATTRTGCANVMPVSSHPYK